MIKYRVFKISIGEYNYKNSDLDSILRNHFDQWYKTEVGEWVKENNIKLVQGEMVKDQNTYEYVYQFFIQITPEQQKEYNEIIFYQKLMRQYND